MKGKILTLFIGILIGAIITTAGFMIYNKVTANTKGNQEMMNGQMQDGGEMPTGEKPDGNPPEMQNDDENSTRPEMPEQEQSSSDNNV